MCMSGYITRVISPFAALLKDVGKQNEGLYKKLSNVDNIQNLDEKMIVAHVPTAIMALNLPLQEVGDLLLQVNANIQYNLAAIEDLPLDEDVEVGRQMVWRSPF